MPALRDVDLDVDGGRGARHPGAQRLGQEHAAPPARRHGPSHGGRGLLPRPGPDARSTAAGLTLLPPAPRRLRLPVLQPDPEPDRARERRDGDARSRREPRDPREMIDLVGLGRARRPLPRAAVRRRAAARGDRARRREGARRAPLRRADRRARLRDGHPRARRAPAGEPRARHDAAPDHPQRGDRRHGGPRGPHAAPAASSRRARTTSAEAAAEITLVMRHARPQAAPQPRLDEGPGGRDRADRRVRRGELRDGDHGLPRPARRRATRTTGATAWPTSSRRSKRAPRAVLRDLERVPGVRRGRGAHRVRRHDRPPRSSPSPARARVLSVPDRRERILNDLHLTAGQWFTRRRDARGDRRRAVRAGRTGSRSATRCAS